MRHDAELNGIGDTLLGAYIRKYQTLKSELADFEQAITQLERDPRRPSQATRLLVREKNRLESEIRSLVRTPVLIVDEEG